MTENERQQYLCEQYDDYIRRYHTTSEERRMLRNWVAEGHSIYESPGSRYLCDQYPAMDFLDTYRQDKEIRRALAGKSEQEKCIYMKEYMGHSETGAEAAPSRKTTKEHIRELEHDLFYLWEYLCSEGLWNEAKDYLEEHKEDEIPFGYEG